MSSSAGSRYQTSATPPDIASNGQAGIRQLGRELAMTLGVRPAVVHKLFGDWCRHLSADWRYRPAVLAHALEHTPADHWPSSAADWQAWNDLTRILIDSGSSDVALTAALPALYSAQRRRSEAGASAVAVPPHAVVSVRALIGWLDLAVSGLDAQARAGLLGAALVRNRVGNPANWQRKLEDAWREAFMRAMPLAKCQGWHCTVPLPTFEFNGWSLAPLTSAACLAAEGEEMRNCLASYRGHLLMGQALYFGLKDSGHTVAHLEMRLYDDAPHVVLGDVRGRANRELPQVLRLFSEMFIDRVRECVSAKGIRAYRARCVTHLTPHLPADWPQRQSSALLKAMPDILGESLLLASLRRLTARLDQAAGSSVRELT